ncbi:MAG: right-handed parallel beta-helix repeat-containing protein, partial [Flavobacteriales bacterium]
PVEVLSISIDNSTHIKASDRIVLQPAKQKPLDFKVQCFKLPEGFEWHEYLAKRISVNYEIVGATGILKAKCHKWSQPQIDFFSKDIIRRKPNVEEFNFLLKDEDAKTITIKEGNWNIRQTLIVPKDYVLKGTGNIKLNLLNKSMILSYSPIELIGSEKHPVEIYSTDSTGMGILVMNSGSASLLKQVRFNNLSNPSENDWKLTGAITFYQAPLKIEHCGFYQNRSEDALNIVRSGFAMENCLFSGTSSDAFDTDFSSGTISSTSFLDCGNEAIDISGGQVSVSDVLIDHPGDKGISVGENGRVSIDKTEIRNAELAITSKDKSDVEIHDVRIIKSRVGFVVFEKKAEYGPASMSVEGFRYEDLEVPYLLEKNSTLTIDGESMKPGDYKVKDMLYGIKYGKSSK